MIDSAQLHRIMVQASDKDDGGCCLHTYIFSKAAMLEAAKAIQREALFDAVEYFINADGICRTMVIEALREMATGHNA